MTHPPEYEPDIPQPTPHAYVPDEWTRGATCAVCGFDSGFGLLHPEALGTTEAPDPPLPSLCRDCKHYSHEGRVCPDGIRTWRGVVPCGCSREGKAA